MITAQADGIFPRTTDTQPTTAENFVPDATTPCLNAVTSKRDCFWDAQNSMVWANTCGNSNCLNPEHWLKVRLIPSDAVVHPSLPDKCTLAFTL